MNQTPENSTRGSEDRVANPSLKDRLEVTSKVLLGLAGLCYVLGLIVVPLHLRPYGVNSLDLPQLHYAVAGMWAVLPIVLIALSVLCAAFLISAQLDDRSNKPKGKVDLLFKLLGIVASTVFLIPLVFGVLLKSAGVIFSWKAWVWIPLGGTVATLITLVGFYAIRKLTRSDSLAAFVSNLGILVIGSTAVVIYVIYFARYTYPTIPRSAGGGRTNSVRLFVPSNLRPQLEIMDVPLAKEERNIELLQTDRVPLLLGGEKQLIIINSHGRAVSLPTDVVKWITYEE